MNENYKNTPRIEKWLAEGMLTEKQVEFAKKYMEENFNNNPSVTLEMVLLKSGAVKEPLKEPAESLYVTQTQVDEGLLSLVPDKMLKERKVIPLRRDANNLLVLGMVHLADYKTVDEFRDIYDVKKVEKVLVNEESLDSLYEKIFKFTVEESEENTEEQMDEENDDSYLEDDSPIIKFVNDLLHRAISMNVSDIHIEPQVRKNTRVRLRLDGELVEYTEIPRKWHQQLVSRVKIMSNLDISNRYEPQDGEIKFKVKDSHINLRINILPLVHNEKIVIRILGQADTLLPLEEVGLSTKNYEYIMESIHKKQGMVLITGPTGSGKTTTMYAMLQKLNSINKNISTIEDPVELSVPGLNQVQISKRTNFAGTLRALLRQDPDIIMIGEVRDKETAEISVRSALTGHIVLSTLHTNNALSTVTRLMDMEVEPYLLADALNLVVSQRLVRRICENCKIADENGLKELHKEFISYIENPTQVTIYKGVGCEKCGNTGFKGRLPVHEVLLVDDELRALMIQGDVQGIRGFGKKNLMVEDVIQKLLEGKTSMEEVKKILLDF